MKEFVLPNDITIIGRHPHYHARDDDPPRVGHMLEQDANKKKKFPNNGMNRETKTARKISLVKTNLVSVRVTSSLFVTRDPNLY